MRIVRESAAGESAREAAWKVGHEHPARYVVSGGFSRYRDMRAADMRNSGGTAVFYRPEVIDLGAFFVWGEDMQFIAEYTVDEMDFLSFVRINRYIRGKVPRRLITIVTAAASVLLAALCVLVTLRGVWTAKNAIIVAIGVMLIGWELRRDRYYANENRRKMTGYVEKMQLSADESGINISSDGNVEHVDYKRIEAIYHCRASLFVYVAGDRAYIIPDGAFSTGTAADFAAYAAKKCGKSVNNVSI